MTKRIKSLIISISLVAVLAIGCNCEAEVTTLTEVITSTTTAPTTVLSTVYSTINTSTNVISTISTTVTETVTDTTTIIPGYTDAPNPTFNDTCGAILGRVLHEDGTPAYMYYVALFVGDAYYCAYYYTDQNGYYSISQVRTDVCMIYVFAIRPYDDITGDPDAIVTPQGGTITTVPDIIVS